MLERITIIWHNVVFCMNVIGGKNLKDKKTAYLLYEEWNNFGAVDARHMKL
jgi:hypothetical protein